MVMAEVEDHTSLFCFNFIVEKFKSTVPTDCLFSQGVSFRLLDFPAVLLTLPVPSNLEKVNVIKRQVLSKDGALKLNKGKSCTFRMMLGSLVSGLRERPMVVQLVKLTPGGADDKQSSEARGQRTVGSALLDLSEIAAALECATKGNGTTTKCSAGDRRELCFIDATGTELASLHVRYQLSSEGAHTDPHITRENKSNHSILQHHQNAKRNTGTLGSHKNKYSKANQMSCEVEFVAEKAPNNNETSLMRNTNLDLEPLSVESQQSEKNDSQTLAACIYLPNAVCPPPLFYYSGPKPHDLEKTGGFVQPTIQHAEVVNDNVGQVSDSAQSHWSVLMAHDQASHPLTVKHSPCRTTNPVETGSSTNSALRVTSFPLLSALLEELSVLRSQILPPAEQTTKIPKLEPQKASKCLQTDIQLNDGPDSFSVQKLQESSKQDSPQCTAPQHSGTGHGRKFLRECCMLKHPSALRVPKHKSVIYPPDIARIKRKNFQKKARLSTNAARLPPRMQKGARTAEKQPKPSSKQCSSDGSITREISEKVDIMRDMSAEIVSSAVRKLEVFIPQASHSTESSQASSSLIGSSVASLKSHDEDGLIPTEQTDTEAETVDLQLMDAGTQTNMLLNSESVVAAVMEQKDQKGTIVDVSQSCQGTALQSPNLSPQEDTLDKSQSLSTSAPSVTQRADSQGVPQETQDDLNGGENTDTVPHKQTPFAAKSFAAKSFAASNVSIVVTHAGNLSQEPPTARSVDNIPSLYASKKPSSLLNIASQTLDSFVSTNSLDVMDSAVLPKHLRNSLVYLATSQSTCAEPSQSDDADQNSEDSYSQDYPDDFEQFDSDSGSNSSTTSSST